jgi:hypothetical protein
MAYEQSTIHASTVAKTKTNNSKGLFYHASYEVENFIQTVQDSGNGSPFKVLNDPTWQGFKLFFHFDAQSGLLADEQYINSALAYLNRIGQTERYDLLKRFISTLSKVNSITPWIFQEISGLDEIWTKKRIEPRYENMLNIKCLETIDGKIMSLIKMYRDIAFDEVRWVWILPPNLRKFSMSVYMYDFRVFDDSSQTARELLQTIDNTDVKKLNHLLFDCGHCEFMEDSGKDFFGSVTNNPSEFSSTNLSIRTEAIEISGLFKSITGDTRLTSSAFELANAASSRLGNTNSNKTYVDRLKDRVASNSLVKKVSEQYDNIIDLENWKKQLKNINDDASASVLSLANNQLASLYLGNIHGFGFDDIARLKENGNYRTTFNQIYSQQSSTKSLAGGDNTREPGALGAISTDGQISAQSDSIAIYDDLGNVNG